MRNEETNTNPTLQSTIADVSSHRVQFEMTKKRAVALMEMATDSEKGEIEWRMEALRKRYGRRVKVIGACLHETILQS